MENKNKKLNFADLTINSTALLCPNPTEWFARAYLDEDVAKNFRVIPGVKYKTNVANVNFSSVLVAESCDWSASASVLSAKTMQVCPVQAQVQVCKKDIETSFVALEMAKGSANWSNVSDFMNHYWEALSAEIKEEIEYIRWNGLAGSTGFTGSQAYLALCTGYHARLTGTTGVISSATTTINSSNVIAYMGFALQAAPATITSKKSQLRFYVASNVANAYRIATSLYNTNTNVTTDLPFTFSNIEIVEAPGMSNNRILLTRKDNLVYLLDGENDANDLTAIDLSNTTGEKVLRTSAMLKIGFDIVNPTEFVYFY